MPGLATANAPTSYAELETLLKDDDKVKVCGVDIDGVLRGKVMTKSKFLSSTKTGFGFCSVIFNWDILDNSYAKPMSSSADGMVDILATVDLSSFRRIPWERNIPLFLVSFGLPSGGGLDACPRSLLERMVRGVKRVGGEGDWEVYAGAEFEYFQFKETPQSLVQKKFVGLEALTPGMHGYSMLRPNLNQDYFYDLFDEAKRFGIEIEGHHTETGPGVFESALEYTEARRMADNAVLFKLLAKSVGHKYGIMPTFMAKPYSDLPGTSGHIHVSVRDKSGKNVFALSEEEIKAGGRKDAAFKDTRLISQTAEYFLAGIMSGLPEVLPMLCPNINSYKRLSGGAAFWAPDLCSFGYDSRAAAVRIIGPPDTDPKATRFEVRVPGADMHPMLAFSAIIGLGARGIEKKLTIPMGPIGAPGVSRNTLPHLPTSLEAANARFMAKGSIAREVFGDGFVDHFGGSREHELAAFRKAVTNWETERYFELA